MKRYLFALLLLAACSPARAPAAPLSGAHVLPGRAVILPTLTPSDDPIVEVHLVHASGREDILFVGVLVTPDASQTPTPTITPTPSITPPPTSTPRPSATSMPNPTPTPENTLVPPGTPIPTSVPKETCYAGVIGAGLNVRSNPSTDGVKYGVLVQAARIPVYLIHVVKPEGDPQRTEWGMVEYAGKTAWIALWYGGVELARLEDNANCWEVPVEYQTTYNLLGFHLIVGANNSFILGGAKVGGAKGTSDTQPLLDQLKAVNPNATTIYRSLHNANGMIDGPLPNEWYNPDIYYAKLKPYLDTRADFNEFINEWPLPKLPDGKDDWPQWERFTIRILERFTADGQCALFGSFGPGAPDLPGWPYVVNVMRWSDAHPCQPGRYHGWATHTTLPMPDWIPINPASYIRNPWIIDRDLIFRDYALANKSYNLADFKGGVWVTEGGWTDYSVNFDRDFTCEEAAAGWNLTQADYATRRPWVKLVNLWTLTRTGDPSWYNLQPCLPLLFR